MHELDLQAIYLSALRGMLSLLPEERQEMWRKLKYNEYFCVECGYGSVEHPNKNCQCWNDE